MAIVLLLYIFISSNIEDTIDLPVNLSITDDGLLLGDVNFDSVINVLDVVMIVGYVLGNSELTEIQIEVSDLNNDGIVNILDIVQIVAVILNN